MRDRPCERCLDLFTDAAGGGVQLPFCLACGVCGLGEMGVMAVQLFLLVAECRQVEARGEQAAQRTVLAQDGRDGDDLKAAVCEGHLIFARHAIVLRPLKQRKQL